MGPGQQQLKSQVKVAEVGEMAGYMSRRQRNGRFTDFTGRFFASDLHFIIRFAILDGTLHTRVKDVGRKVPDEMF